MTDDRNTPQEMSSNELLGRFLIAMARRTPEQIDAALTAVEAEIEEVQPAD